MTWHMSLVLAVCMIFGALWAHNTPEEKIMCLIVSRSDFDPDTRLF